MIYLNPLTHCIKHGIAVALVVFVCLELGSSVLAGGMAQGPRNLTVEQQIVYQRAIEEVYWRHRIWPKENPQPKPPLDDMMPPSKLRAKVEDYLRKSEGLELYWQRPVRGEQLQAEIERMARQTKRPEMLKELWQALGNDPYVIAECLARPVLVNRLIRNWYAQDERYHGELKQKKDPFDVWWKKAGEKVGMPVAGQVYGYRLPDIGSRLGRCKDDTWEATLTPIVSHRSYHTAVWTGNEMIVWGGISGLGIFLNTGGRYDPATDTWVATGTTNAPSPRSNHTAIWTGSEMIVWGGSDGSRFFDTGGRYDPVTDSWAATSTTNAPSPRREHTAVWTGGEMIVWGGGINTGGRYDPVTDSWVATSTTNAPSPRSNHTAVWTGSEMIVWGGVFPETDTWRSLRSGDRQLGSHQHHQCPPLTTRAHRGMDWR